MKMDYLELRMKREVTEQDLVRWAGLVTATTALVPFPWRRRAQTMFLRTQEETKIKDRAVVCGRSHEPVSWI